MNKKDIIEYIVNNNFPYRKILDIPSKTGFGYEIEFSLSKKKFNILKENFKDTDYKFKTETSVSKINGFELNTPVFYNNVNTWKEINDISNILKKYNADFYNSSFQVNIDNDLDEDQFINFLKLYASYDDVIYNFSKGVNKKIRHIVKEYANSFGYELYDFCIKSNNKNFLIDEISYNKFYAINYKKSYKIIEFRAPNSTFNSWLWQNYTNTFINMTNAVKNKDIDYEKINIYLKRFDTSNYNYLPKSLMIEKAFEFIDIVFEKDIDKLYFMKQYLNNLTDKKILSLLKK